MLVWGKKKLMVEVRKQPNVVVPTQHSFGKTARADRNDRAGEGGAVSHCGAHPGAFAGTEDQFCSDVDASHKWRALGAARKRGRNVPRS